MKNEQLRKDLKGILANKSNIKSYTKSDTGGKSIEIVFVEPNTFDPLSFDTYVYYGNEADRDADFELLQKELA